MLMNGDLVELPDFNALSASMGAIGNGLGDAATEVAKIQNLPVMNSSDQLNRMEQTQLRILCELSGIRNELHQNVGDLRQDFNRADGNSFVGPSLHLRSNNV